MTPRGGTIFYSNVFMCNHLCDLSVSVTDAAVTAD